MRILIVEDESKIAYALKKGLEQENYTIDIALDGELGFDMAITEPYDLIILDIMLPKKSGLDICKDLRKSGVKTPILMLTARTELEDRVYGLNTGADDYLTKPFAFEELLARIRALLRRPQSIQDEILVCEDLIVNPLNYVVTRNGEEINLSKKEFTLLEYLLRNKDKILSKDKITEHVWEYDSDILPNTVEQYIGYLRNKIDKKFPNKPQLIHTIRGFGYKISK